MTSSHILDLEICLLWVNKLVDLQKLLETNENKHKTVIQDCLEFLHSLISKYSSNIMELIKVNKDNDLIKAVLITAFDINKYLNNSWVD